MKRRNFIKFVGTCCCSALLYSCSTVPITERRQLSIIPESVLNRQAAAAYEKIRNKSKLSDDKKTLNKIKTIGKKIEEAVNQYFIKNNLDNPTSSFDWDYILIDNDKIKNAWCMPGGKIAVYSGLLPITKNDDGLAAVMGHEVAHAVAKHSIERASRGVLVNIGTAAVDIASGGALSRTSRATGVNVSGMLRKFGIDNPFNRKQESEADYLGLIFSSLSGFEIRETILIWERMQKAQKGKNIPEWMSTHPSTKKRISSLNKWIPEIMLKYPPIKNI
ncbi:MAG: peptidase M48 [Candidatus Pelagibacter sp. TMED64]|nr:peptidase M48 [Candidatus Pelagibacter sp.]OUU66829.1 MAG: peptidase M48 [Candidatus Pelagibacter sp. TMED64]|tara:strand:- start:7974 stop:8801 length:828 start_codon:yes stop_codon:yes gene_type:complete